MILKKIKDTKKGGDSNISSKITLNINGSNITCNKLSCDIKLNQVIKEVISNYSFSIKSITFDKKLSTNIKELYMYIYYMCLFDL